MKRVLLDQGLSPATAIELRTVGWDALHVMELGLDRADDSEILAVALKDGRTCITLDHDFHAHLARAQMCGPSVVFVRIEGLHAPAQAELIRKVWDICGDAILTGAAVSVSGDSIRIRKLPLR